MLVIQKSKPIMPGRSLPLAVPLPFNTPSLTKENKGTTNSTITLVPGGNTSVWASLTSSSNTSNTAAGNDASKSENKPEENKPAPVVSSFSSPAPWVKPSSHELSSQHDTNKPISASKNWADDESDEEDRGTPDRRQRFGGTGSSVKVEDISQYGRSTLPQKPASQQNMLGFNQLPDRVNYDNRTGGRGGEGGGLGYNNRDNENRYNNNYRDRDNRGYTDRSGEDRDNRGETRDYDRERPSGPPEPSWVS